MMVSKLIDAILAQRLMVVSLSVLLLVGGLYAFKALKATPAKFEAESATNETHKGVAPDGP